MERKQSIWKKLLRSKTGQSMTEYVVVLALVAVATIKVTQLFGNSIKIAYGRVVSALQGQTYSGSEYDKLDDVEDITKPKDLKDFDE